jgi:hypothetical protein
MVPRVYYETSATIYPSMLRNVPEERRPYLHCDLSVKSLLELLCDIIKVGDLY